MDLEITLGWDHLCQTNIAEVRSHYRGSLVVDGFGLVISSRIVLVQTTGHCIPYCTSGCTPNDLAKSSFLVEAP